jgi:TonB-dependent starch-binding outer membrane protein SusC
MRKFQSVVVAVFCALLCARRVYAQVGIGSIAGFVMDSSSRKPIESAYVYIVGTKRAVPSAKDGSFVLDSVPEGSVILHIRSIGYRARALRTLVRNGERASVRVLLSENPFQSSCTLVFRGAPSARTDSTALASTSVNGSKATVGLLTNHTQLLTARVAGVNVTQNNGEPGANAQVRIRGGSSVIGSNEPLYVVDGVPVQNIESEARGFGIGGTPALGRNPLNAINPADIESITVLKDAVSTAMYGIRGANGVVVIETKRGSAGRFTMEYETYAAASSRARTLRYLNGNEYRAFVAQEVSAGRLPPSRAASQGASNTDWEAAVARTSFSQNHNLSFTGGTASSQFRASLNFADEQGVVISSGFKRLQGRFNGNHYALKDKLHFELNLSSARIENDYLPYESTGGFEGGVFQNVATYNPTRPISVRNPATGEQEFFETGPGAQGARNPVALANQILDNGVTTRTIGSFRTSYAIAPTVTARISVGVDRSNGVRDGYLPRTSPVGAAFNGLAQQSTRTVAGTTLLGLLVWAPQAAGNLDFDVSGGYEYNRFRNTDIADQSQVFAAGVSGYRNLRAGQRPQPQSSSLFDGRLVSLLTSANLAYRGRYIVSGALRRDGTSQFDSDHTWSIAPAISTAWLISKESFAQGLPFSQLKLRAGYGQQCNAGIAIDIVPNVIVGTTLGAGSSGSKCERTAQRNIAIDFALLHSRVSGSLDLYRRNSTHQDLDLLVPRFGNTFAPPISGASSQTGVELSIDAVLARGAGREFTFNAGLVFSAERSRVENLETVGAFANTSRVSGQGQSGVFAQRIIPGQPLGTFFGAKFAGFNATGNQTFVRYTVTRDAQGNETSRAVSGVTTNPTGDDFVVIGNANPNFSLGLRSNASWKGFDASWLWRVEQGRDVFNNTALASSAKSNVLQDRNFLRSALSTPEGITEPALYSSRWIEDGSFIRLQNVTIGYSFLLPFTRQPVRAYVAGDNLLLFTKYTGYDPEVFTDAGIASRGVDYLAYPRARTVMAGLRIRF